MKRLFFAIAGIVAGMNVMAQTNDPIIMKINGKNITRSEFEYSYNKNNSDGVLDKKTVEEYVPLYVDFKLKVAAAEAAKYDTLTSINKELRGYKEQLVLPTIVDTAYIERTARETYDNTVKQFGGEDILTASHILVLMRQDADANAQAAAKTKIDSIYNVLKGVPSAALADRFAEVAKECSEDPGSAARGGALGQFGRGRMIPDFENAAFALKKGQMSAPIKSTVGYHIIYMTDRHPFEPYEFHHDAIIRFLEQRGIKEQSANVYVDSIAKLRGVTRDVVIDELGDKLWAEDADVRNLAQEYYDGTLMYEISKNEVWDKAQKDEAGQAQYFKDNKSDYAWEQPRFCGIIIHAKDVKTLKTAKKVLKGVPEEDWAKKLVETFNNDSVKLVRIEKGIFKQGDNATVDKLAFKAKTEIKAMKDYPETDIFGKVYKTPRTYKDVQGQVTTDYQNAQEKKWVEGLRSKFEYEVYDDVVKTVNKH